MATWGEMLAEARRLQPEAAKLHRSPFDILRRRYLEALSRRTGRNVILYASKWTTGQADPSTVAIGPEDVHGFMEVIHGLSGDGLDVMLHLPGGSAEATEALVTYLRSKFNDIRVIVPQAAMSAATMLACAANRIVMARHSSIGPIDPQFFIPGDGGVIRSIPAHAILEQFELAKAECKRDPTLLGSWLPILRQYGPGLIVECKLAQKLSETLVSDWLSRYMFASSPTAVADAQRIAGALSKHDNFFSHSRFISRDSAKAYGLVVDDLESDQGLQDDVLSVFHATIHTFNATPCVKLIENHLGKAFVKQAQMMLIAQPSIVPPGAVPPAQPNSPAGPGTPATS